MHQERRNARPAEEGIETSSCRYRCRSVRDIVATPAPQKRGLKPEHHCNSGVQKVWSQRLPRRRGD